MSIPVPGRILLDTNVINLVVDHGNVIFDEEPLPDSLPNTEREDVIALHHLFRVGERAMWELAVSPTTYREISSTTDTARRRMLERAFGEYLIYWQDIAAQTADVDEVPAIDLGRRVSGSPILAALPDVADRELVAHAIAYGCDAMCTLDRKTILRRRHMINVTPLKIITPGEWWKEVEPYAALWM